MSDAGDLERRAARAVAGFTSTRSKGPDAMFGGPGGPTHLVRTGGARVETADGRELLDWTMALGAVALGYAHPRVVEAAARAARDGAVGPLPHRLEVEVAERLCAAYPGARLARWFKTGAEAVQAAVRVARIATGRERVVHVGYHGWLDGPTVGAGVPRGTAAMWSAAPFDDLAALEERLGGEGAAAVVVEPVIERAPSAGYLEAVRRLATDRGAVLVFDEIKTGYRLAAGGAAARWGVHPDLAVLGKALANGYPLAALLGRADLMARVRETWISSTLATEFVALAAAGAVLDVWAEVDVAAHLARVGARARDALAVRAAEGGWTVEGIPEMWFLRFPDPDRERRFLLGCAGHGVLLKRGAYNFPSLAHGHTEIEETMRAVAATLAEFDR
ncbi:MAG TPA: aminotransferase class III-fold pyridoxal phosphate-dependent enzyme [Gemmatimonadales bacterium]|nr:aminotransferase class III-fold pyridoxal phosphate-dependent enzyme [Gemmatimonadales bacterium]